jgi:hypothetical protein
MRLNKALLCGLAILALFSFHAPQGECWEDETHKMLTDAAVGPAVIGGYEGFYDYLSTWHFGWLSPTPVIPAINQGQIRDWIRQGAVDEDKPVTRSFYHFHDPLKPWGKAGLSLIGLSWKSSILWSQTPLGQQSYSWKNARQYYYKALSASTDSERQQAYAMMFQSLGHIMHLVEDAAVPDHTRNDTHVVFSIEKWVEEHSSRARGYIPDSFYMDELQPIFDYPANPLAPVRIANLFDTDQYTGANPEISTSPMIGIAEYSNANFLSKGTIFTYDHPAPASTEPGSTERYLRKFTAGEKIEHFLLAGPDWPDTIEEKTYDLDDRCYEDYAKLLLPKAAKYAAMIPNYFFRATLLGAYGGDDAGTFTYVLNLSNEVMANGIIEIYARKEGGSWKRIGQAPSGYLPPGRSEAMLKIYLDCYDCFADYPGPWTIVFRGTLGSEKDAVAANLYMTPL